MKVLKIVIVLISFVGLEHYAYGQNAKEIVTNYKKALKKSAEQSEVNSLEIEGDFNFQKLMMPLKIYFKTPHFTRVEMRFQNLLFIQLATDSLKWEFNEMENKSLVTTIKKNSGGDSNENNSTFDFASKILLEYPQNNYSVRILKKQNIDSLEVFVLECSKSKRENTKVFINTKTNLIYKIEDEKGYRYFANYITVDGFVFPQFMIDSNSGQPMEAHFKQIKINSAIPDSLFEIPMEALEQKVTTENETAKLFKAADSNYEKGNYDSALWYYNRILKSSTENYRAYNSRGLSKIALKDYYDAIADFNRAIELDSNASKAFNNRGLAKSYLGDQKGALQDYNRALKKEPTMRTALVNRGNLYMNMQEYNLSLQDYKAMIKINSKDGEAYFGCGISLAHLQQYKEALEYYSIARENNFVSADLYNYQGVSQYKLEDYSSAAASFNLAIRLDENNLQYLENYARSFYELGDYEKASNLFVSYIKRNKENSEIHNLLGLCKYHQENYKGAIAHFTTAISLNSGSTATYFDNRAAAKEMLDDFVGAISDYSESIKLYPNDPSVFYKRGLVKIHTSKKIEGCLDLATANEMHYEPAKEAILKNCN